MRRSSMPLTPVALASLAAGPILTVSTALAALYLQLPRPVAVAVGLAEIAPVILLVIPVVLVGFILSIVPNLIGSLLLLFAGEAVPAARARPVWIGTGALFGAAIAWSTGSFAAPAYAFGLVLTSALCAAICRLSASWD